MKQKLFSMLALLLMAATGAYATEFTSLKVGDVLHVGDVINTGTNYTVYGAYLDAGSQPATLVRADISDPMTITESETGAYYFIKTKTDGYTGIIFGEGFEGGYWPVTDTSDGISVTAITPGDYGYTELTFAVHEGPATYKITVAEGTEDEGNWTIEPTEAAEGSPVTATYSGKKKVKSVKAVKKAAVNPNAYLTWDADQKKLVATEIPTTATKVTSSTTTWEAGTYVVEGQVKIDGSITLNGEVNLIIKDGAKLTANKIVGANKNLSIYGQAQKSGELVVDNSGDDAITSIKTLEVHSAKVTATSSKKDRGGFYYTRTINVYDGSVDATAANGYGIWLTVDGSINIYGGEVKAVGKGTGGDSYGIKAGGSATVTVNGGNLWAENADKQALQSYITLKKGTGFTGKIEYSSDKSTWSETVDANAKYVRAGY